MPHEQLYRLSFKTGEFCPVCGKELLRSTGEDEFGGDVLIPYDRYECLDCKFECDFEDLEDIRKGLQSG